ncbi:ABC transporter ATP-binding protein [Denitromonas iodatirespirans]|uniref:ABC transporter ATP-binding protein n=1 Tax=Denitromonas iodatirespirans TaxID=2795389 RepID=A0A944H9V9_DENI1|nr:ABC transporter ATP-binding protein [Denitromonas iodatirespirans]MBT0959932.1 ABC transporter ATP-binding protein [Denitromonas iodatirespirans]
MTSSAVTLSALRFAWPGAAQPCLEVPDFRLAAGERLFLHGPSGSGKTTLLSLIAGVLSPSAGRVQVLDTDLGTLSGRRRDRFRAEHIGIVFQQFNLIPYLSAADNIALPCRFSPARAQRAGDVAAAVRRLAGHLDLSSELLARPAAELSVGQQQRVAAARALIGAPALVIADEPTSSLDAARQDAFLALLLAECTSVGASLLFVSHDLRLAGRFDRCAELAELNRAAEVTA